MAAPQGQAPARYDDYFERVDRLIYRLEIGVISFALMAMSVTYLFKIVYEAAIADRNFVVQFLLRWLPTEWFVSEAARVASVKAWIAPMVLLAVMSALSLGAGRTIRQARAGAPQPWALVDLLWSGLVAALLTSGVLAIVWLPAKLLCAVCFAVGVVVWGRPRAGEPVSVAYIVVWCLLSLPIGMLLWRVPTQYDWVNDLTKVLIMYVGFVGASMASREQKHIVLNFGRKLWPQRTPRLAEGLSLTVWLLFNVLLTALAWHLFALQLDAGSSLSILPIPEYHIALPVVLSFALMTVRVLADLIRVSLGRRPVEQAVQSAANGSVR